MSADGDSELAIAPVIEIFSAAAESHRDFTPGPDMSADLDRLDTALLKVDATPRVRFQHLERIESSLAILAVEI
jgi:hypothetical protein